MSTPKCLLCKHYYSTFIAELPRGCKLYGFKTASIPAQVIKRETGSDCESFEQRASRKVENPGLDLNDPSLWGDE